MLNDPFVPVVALFIGGFAIIGIELYFKSVIRNQKSEIREIKDLTYKDALLIGLMQSISMIPGVSRSASSIFGGMLLKFDRKSAVEFSFLLAIPTMIIATGYDLASSWSSFSESQLSSIFIGIVFSFISALLIIKWLLKFVQNNNFISFGIYRIVLSVIYFMLFLR